MKTPIFLLLSITLVVSIAVADPRVVKNSVENDMNIPEEIKSLVVNDLDRHTTGAAMLYKSNINQNVFTLSNPETYMVFEATDKLRLVLYLLLSEDTGLVELVWSSGSGGLMTAEKD